jgi:hypothetical protein
MTGCPIAYSDPCSKCAQYGNCAPSQAVRKLEELEKQVRELMRLIDRKDEKRYSRIS